MVQATLSSGQVRKSARHRGSSAPGGPHSSPAHTSNDPRRSPGLLPKQPLETRLAAVIETATSTSAPLMTKTEPRQDCIILKAAKAAEEAWQQTIGGLQGPGVPDPTIASLENPSSASQDEDSEDMDFSAPRKSRLGAPQLQAQLSRFTDRTRLRRLKSTLLSKGAWQDVRIEDLCHTHVSHKLRYHMDACAGSVLTPHDYITNVQKKRLGNKAWTGCGECRLCASFLDLQLEHGETCSTAEATRGHCACVHAVLGGLGLADPGIGTQRAHSNAIQAG